MTAREKKLHTQVLALRKRGYSLRDMQEFYPVSIAVLSRLTRGQFPKSPAIRSRLGLVNLTFEKRLEGHPDKDRILTVYKWLECLAQTQPHSRQLSLF
jgi:hypothetical protein